MLTPLMILLMAVVGEVPATGETFAGHTAGMDVVIHSDHAECRGPVHVDAPHYGTLTLRCTDGRLGRATVHFEGELGTAYGTLGGRALSLDFG